MRARARIVPAEVISVEDRLAGSLSMVQAGFLGAPLFLAAFLLLAPPRLVVAPYKVLLVVLVGGFCLPLALRVQGRLVVFWLAVLWSYRSRPRRWALAPPPDSPVKSGETSR